MLPLRVIVILSFAFMTVGTVVWAAVKNVDGCTVVPSTTVIHDTVVYECQKSDMRFFLSSAHHGPGYKRVVIAADKPYRVVRWTGDKPDYLGKNRWSIPYALDSTVDMHFNQHTFVSITFVKGR